MRLLSTPSALLIAGLAVLGACAGFEPQQIAPRASVAYSPELAGGYTVTRNPIAPHDTLLNDFKSGAAGWEAAEKFELIPRDGTSLQVKVNGVGPQYASFTYKFDALDLQKAPVVAIKMRAVGPSAPYVRIDLGDGNSMDANAVPQVKQISTDGEATYYVFDFNNKFRQGFPIAGDVDQGGITSIKVFVNPGMEAWSGDLFFEEIRLWGNKNGTATIDRALVIDDYTSGDLTNVWACTPGTEILTQGENALKVELKDAFFHCFGEYMGTTDATKFPVIRIRARAEGNLSNIKLLARFIDADNGTTDNENKEMYYPMDVGTSDYVDLYFDYSKNLIGLGKEFDPKQTVNVIVFVNVDGGNTFTGTLYVDEIALMGPNDVPKGVNLQPTTGGRSCAVALDAPKGQADPMLSDFTMGAPGWMGEGSLLAKPAAGVLKVEATATGPNWDKVVGSITPTNMDANRILKVRMKTSGNMDPLMRLHLIDNFGVVTNGAPPEVTIKRSGEFQDVYFDLRNGCVQRLPSYSKVNYGRIEKLELLVNPGNPSTFTGTIEIESIEAVDSMPSE